MSWLLDPDCRAGKHSSCAAGPCECICHDDNGLNGVSPAGQPGGLVEDTW